LPSIDFIAEETSWCFPAIKQFLSIQSYVLLGHSVGVVTVSAQAFVEAITLQGIEDASIYLACHGRWSDCANGMGPKQIGCWMHGLIAGCLKRFNSGA